MWARLSRFADADVSVRLDVPLHVEIESLELGCNCLWPIPTLLLVVDLLHNYSLLDVHVQHVYCTHCTTR